MPNVGLTPHFPVLQALGAKVTHASSQQPGYEAHLAIDGDPATIWHTAWQPAVARHPHQIEIDLGREIRIAGFTYLPRQDMANGRIAEYELSVSPDGRAWGEPVVRGRFPDGKALESVRFDAAVACRFVRLTALSEAGGGPWASVAELDLILDE